ncbi:hypothetical protein BIW11_10862 [Tropilaelaps mercedesae]|uniref:Uncharacterized protein n=1 Tax=Tropilaelaps mercedesae TaxID=418985 RepID=A0A1V9XDP1_9ACAR|nr:hypothetical protein BIW11_10862 [Tropilaelaps mercedesae]
MNLNVRSLCGKQETSRAPTASQPSDERVELLRRFRLHSYLRTGSPQSAPITSAAGLMPRLIPLQIRFPCWPFGVHLLAKRNGQRPWTRLRDLSKALFAVWLLLRNTISPRRLDRPLLKAAIYCRPISYEKENANELISK